MLNFKTNQGITLWVGLCAAIFCLDCKRIYAAIPNALNVKDIQ